MVTKKDLDAMSENLSTHFEEMLTKSINELKNTIIDNLKQSNELLQLKVRSLENEVNVLKQDHIEYMKHVEASFQHGRCEQIIVSGIPESVSHEELEEKCRDLLNQIKKYPVNTRDIAACHRVGKKGDTILRFINRKDADDCLENRRKLKNIDRGAVGLEEDVKIFVNENLSPYMSKLAFHCRTLKRANMIEKVTTFKGVVKITRTVGAENRTMTNIIKHKVDLVKIFPNLDEILKI